ncbi:ATP-binding protein [Anaerosporobacter sp.]|uniref:ATP-binding protein n=1 Tax=Anaerosporobacter sp. TaxID=1872529 RepID=UPI00286EBA89|nr:AAA family ATPase [Anaerosporobacter sp.]
MKRKQLDYLIEWKNAKEKCPLFITGAKGVGKTYLVLEFIKDFFRNRIYMNFEQNPASFHCFEQLDLHQMKEELENDYRIMLTENTVLVLDELEFNSPLAENILNLKSIVPDLSIIFISSHCSILPVTSFLYDSLFIAPIDFKEFLEALGYDWYADIIEEHFVDCKPLPAILHREFLNLFDKYLVIGGLPAAVNEYIQLETIANTPEQHQRIDFYYQNYAQSRLSEGDYLKARALYNSIPLQLSKKNKKFQYSLVRRGTTHSLYEAQVDFLVNHNLLLKANPLPQYDFEDQHNNRFKLYQSDVGMLLSKATKDLNYYSVESKKEFSIGLLENYIAGCLFQNGFPLFFWESDSRAKIDFVLSKEEKYIPIEVFADKNTRSRNVFEFSKEFPIEYQMKISMKNFSKEFSSNKKVKYIPLYATYCITKYNI